MFRDVPECSGMFHVPGFIDARSKGGEHYPLEKTLSNIVSFLLTADLSGG